jgi:hypothetical protein
MAKKRCRHCRCLFTLSARNPDQKYCSHPDCQRARKREWQRQKIKDDAGYRGNQKDAQTRWRREEYMGTGHLLLLKSSLPPL